MTESRSADALALNFRRQRERSLRRNVLRGDESAWRAWYDETFNLLLAYAMWRCGGRHDWAEDVVQET